MYLLNTLIIMIETFKKYNCNIQKGLHYIVTGPNGSGKSTLLACLLVC